MRSSKAGMALLTQPVFCIELGLIMIKPTAAELAAFHQLAGKEPILLAPAPESMASSGMGMINHQSDEQIIPLKSLLLFTRQSAVFQAMGGANKFKQWQGRGERCVIHGGDCAGGGIAWSSGYYPVPLCWHHDNEHRSSPVPEISSAIARRLVGFALSQIGAFAGRHAGAVVSPAELAWWAAANEVHSLLPRSLTMLALNRKEQATSRQTAMGWKDTDARYNQRDHGVDLNEKVKAIKFDVDPEPAASFMARPKLTRWQNEAYLKFVRSQPCVVTGTTEAVEAHHVIGHGQSGMAMKTHDLMAFPLSHNEHMKLHDNGWQQWERQHGSQLEHVMATINKAAGLGVFG